MVRVDKGESVKYSTYAECEIIHSVNCEISPVADGFGRCEMKFAFSHLRSNYFTAKLFHLVKPNFTCRRRISLKKERASQRLALFFLEAPPRFELGHKGFADLCLTTWLWRRICEDRTSRSSCGADYGARTRHLDLGKVALYQMS